MAMSALSAAEVVAAAACSAVTSTVRSPRWRAGSGTREAAASSAAVTPTMARYQTFRRPSMSTSGTQKILRAWGMNPTAETVAMSERETPAAESRYGTAIMRKPMAAPNGSSRNR